jgi:hypothetical protein
MKRGPNLTLTCLMRRKQAIVELVVDFGPLRNCRQRHLKYALEPPPAVRRVYTNEWS